MDKKEKEYLDADGNIIEFHRGKPDMINHPPHYIGKNGIEVIDVIEDFVADPVSAYKSNVIKYILRSDKKNGLEDYKKAQFYLNRLIAYIEAHNAWEKDDF